MEMLTQASHDYTPKEENEIEELEIPASSEQALYSSQFIS
jgi:hypothetical protein